MNIEIRPETGEDYSKITEVNDLAFNQPNEGILIEKLRKTLEFISNLSLVAEVDGEVVGHILFYPIIINARNVTHKSLALAPMAVLPDYQNKGIGSHLVKAGFKSAVKLGFQSVIVVGHPNYYPRFGFEQASKFGITAPFDVPDDAFFAIELVTGGLKDVSGMVVYPSEFSDV